MSKLCVGHQKNIINKDPLFWLTSTSTVGPMWSTRMNVSHPELPPLSESRVSASICLWGLDPRSTSSSSKPWICPEERKSKEKVKGIGQCEHTLTRKYKSLKPWFCHSRYIIFNCILFFYYILFPKIDMSRPISTNNVDKELFELMRMLLSWPLSHSPPTDGECNAARGRNIWMRLWEFLTYWHLHCVWESLCFDFPVFAISLVLLHRPKITYVFYPAASWLLLKINCCVSGCYHHGMSLVVILSN